MKCAIKSCKASNVRKNASSILPTFHKIPNDPVQQRAWLRAINRQDQFSVKSAIVCANHFTPDCYVNSLLEVKSKKLKKGAIPTLFLEEEETIWKGEHVQVRNIIFAQIIGVTFSSQTICITFSFKFEPSAFKL